MKSAPVELATLAAPEGSNLIPNMGDGVKAITDLAKSASEITLLDLPTKGLAEGLPETVPLLIDHRPGGLVSNLTAVIEAYRLRPERRRGNAVVTTLASFIDLVNRHKTEHVAIFARTQWPEPKLIGVIDYHEITGTPGHLQHRVNYTFPVTEELKVWIEQNGKWMEQAEFATFLEDHAAELTAPYDGERSEYERLFKEKFATPMDLISLSRNLEVFVGAKVKRAERLSSGERTVEFVEEHSNSKGEKVDIPGVFMLAVPAFIDGEPVRIPARLRYRVANGSIHWAYQLYRWDFWLRERVKEDMDKAAEATALPAYEGAPEA